MGSISTASLCIMHATLAARGGTPAVGAHGSHACPAQRTWGSPSLGQAGAWWHVCSGGACHACHAQCSGDRS